VTNVSSKFYKLTLEGIIFHLSYYLNVFYIENIFKTNYLVFIDLYFFDEISAISKHDIICEEKYICWMPEYALNNFRIWKNHC